MMPVANTWMRISPRMPEETIKHTFRLEMNVVKECRTGQQLSVDFQFATSPRDKMAVL